MDGHRPKLSSSDGRTLFWEPGGRSSGLADVPGRTKDGVGSGTIDSVYLEVEDLVFGFMLATASENFRAKWRNGGGWWFWVRIERGGVAGGGVSMLGKGTCGGGECLCISLCSERVY